jgi:cysteinyl-tRNA synthetase
MSVMIHDPQLGEKIPFVPKDPTRVAVYVCGMTVYDHCHLGHARSAVAFDAIVSHLRRRFGAKNVQFARNVTDVDDKILARAALNGEPIEALTERMVASMHEDLAALGCAPPDHEPRATRHIPDMIALIERLLERGAAYVAPDGEVLFSAQAAPDFGRVSGQRVEGLAPGARVAAGDNKRHPMDFVLWKPQKPGEEAWDAPWGRGRPGWHTECSAMIDALFGSQVDLHGGGEDLKFPHHECECAQSQAASGVPLARHWAHNGFVLASKKRMGKSMGNFQTIKGSLRHFSGEAMRLWVLSAHYRQPLDFSVEALRAAQSRAERLHALRAQAEALLGERAQAGIEPPEETLAALDDDFDTPRALALAESRAKAFRQSGSAADAEAFLGSFAALGLLRRSSAEFFASLPGAQETPGEEVLARAQERQRARASKDWARADRLRAEIADLGWILEDRPEGPSLSPKPLPIEESAAAAPPLAVRGASPR